MYVCMLSLFKALCVQWREKDRGSEDAFFSKSRRRKYKVYIRRYEIECHLIHRRYAAGFAYS